MACYEAGAQAFGWSRRDPRPGPMRDGPMRDGSMRDGSMRDGSMRDGSMRDGSMRDGSMRDGSMRDGPWRMGLGCATSVRPVKIAAATMRVRLGPDGSAEIACAHHEIGNGITTLLALGAADGLGVPVDRVTVRLGDTALPPAGISGGSSTTTSLMNALALGCGQIRAALAQAATGQGGRLAGRDPAALRLAAGRLTAPDGTGIALADAVGPEGIATVAAFVPAGGDREKALADLRQGHVGLALGGGGQAVSWGFGAQFAEVHVHADTGEIRVARLTGAFAAGRILNPLTARSQLTGGMIWGLGSALLEETVVDGAAYRNPDLAEYLVPTAADAPEVEAVLVPDPDGQVDALGLKGLGELGIIGVNAAIANAVHHATGRRLRRLPIRLEDVA
jgi:xanthine dehydrogenase YagR molybdenum-binding subunit